MSTVDDFLNGQGVPVDLRDVEAELSRLWAPAAEEVGGPSDAGSNPNVTRVVLANLVVYCRRAEGPRVTAVLETVAARYPCRIIALSRSEADDDGGGVKAEVSALCHLPAPGLPQVCSERIVLRAGPQGAGLLAGAVRPLLQADLPFVLWWADDPRNDEALFRDLAAECSRLILDLPGAGADPAALRLGLDHEICPYSRDSAWFGLAHWRELIAQFFDGDCALDALRRIDAVRIEAATSDGDETPRLAVWLAAWLAGQTGWSSEGAPTRGPGRLSAMFRGPNGPVSVEIITANDPALDEPMLVGAYLTAKPADGDGAESFRLRREPDGLGKVKVDVDSPSHCALPRTVLAPEMDAAHRIASAIESSRNDPPFRKALPHALWLLGD